MADRASIAGPGSGSARVGRRWLAASAALLLPVAGARAQQPEGQPADSLPASCEGLTVTAVDVEPEPPRLLSGGPWLWRAAGKVLLQQRTTRPHVARDFLRLEPGDRCTDDERAESERILRAQPFLADAELRAVPDGAGGVRLVVRTVDEVPLVIGGSIRDDRVSSARFGNSNVLGQGWYAAGRWEEGGAFRDGAGLRLAHYHAFGGPNVVVLDAERAPLGHDVQGSIAHPFYTPLQRVAWTAAYRNEERYLGLRRRGAPTVSLPADREQWSGGGVVRVGGARLGLFAGALAFHDRIEPTGAPVVVTDAGLVADGVPPLEGYGTTSVTHVAGVLGASALSFLRVEGFDALEGPQDVGRGLQLQAAVDPGVGSGRFYAGDAYAGVGTPHWFVAARGTAEGRQPDDAEGWRDVVVGGRAAWYLKPAARRTIITSVEYAGVWSSRLPHQLTLADRRGGLRGYRDADYAGGRRLVVRSEYRRLVGSVGGLATLGLAGFGEGARLWPGDAPYGARSGTRGSVGLGLLAAVPRPSRRMLRADVAVPVVRGGGAEWEVRVSASSTARGFWREPFEVARLRTSALASGLFTWP